MPTIIFDLDSTLLVSETLEDLLAAKTSDKKVIQKIKEITEQGMSGEIDFLASIQKRLEHVSLNRNDLISMQERLKNHITPGMKKLIKKLQNKKIDIWIISGALRDIVIIAGSFFDIPENHCLGIELEWDSKGNCIGIDESNAMNRSKCEGAKKVSSQWSRPAIAIGDGMTDYALYEKGICDEFIPFTQHKRREALISKKTPEAKNVQELERRLEEILNGKSELS